MDLRQLRQFVAVAEERHFGRAAARLYMTQPALSRTVQQLEREAGQPLLLRHTRAVELTDAGQLLLAQAQRLLADADALVATLREQKDGSGGLRSGVPTPAVVRIGLHDEGLAGLTPVVCDALLRRHPGVEVRVRALPYDQLIDAIRLDRVDALFTVDSVAVRESRFLPVFADPAVAMVPARSELAAASELGVADLLDEPSVNVGTLPETFWGPFLLTGHRNGVAPRFVQGSPTPLNLAELAAQTAAGYGVSVVTAASLTYVDEPDVRFVPVRDAARFSYGVRTPPVPTAASAAVTAAVREVAPAMTGLVPTATSLLPATSTAG